MQMKSTKRNKKNQTSIEKGALSFTAYRKKNNQELSTTLDPRTPKKLPHHRVLEDYSPRKKKG
jgi:hypothetical protein